MCYITQESTNNAEDENHKDENGPILYGKQWKYELKPYLNHDDSPSGADSPLPKTDTVRFTERAKYAAGCCFDYKVELTNRKCRNSQTHHGFTVERFLNAPPHGQHDTGQAEETLLCNA